MTERRTLDLCVLRPKLTGEEVLIQLKAAARLGNYDTAMWDRTSFASREAEQDAWSDITTLGRASIWFSTGFLTFNGHEQPDFSKQ